jgi:hypothetical protein
VIVSLSSKVYQSQNQIPSVRLAIDPLRPPVEQIVSEHTGRQWTVKDARDMTEFACHPCAILSDGSYSVFAKFSQAANGFEQFEIELAGLRLLSAFSGVLPETDGSRKVPLSAQCIVDFCTSLRYTIITA